jgi:hypothetical protein
LLCLKLSAHGGFSAFASGLRVLAHRPLRGLDRSKNFFGGLPNPNKLVFIEPNNRSGPPRA